MDRDLRVTRGRALLAAAVGASVCGAWVLAAVACGSDPSAGPADVGVETSTKSDARVPTFDASDARLAVDAPPWDGQVPFPGEWRPIPGLPASCGVRIAVEPSVSLPPFPWKPCASGRVGCEQFIVDWGAPPDRALFLPTNLGSVFEDASGVHIAYTRNPRGTGYNLGIVQKLHGDVELAIHGSYSTCSVGKAAASAHGIGVVFLEQYGQKSPLDVHVAWSTLAFPGALTVQNVTSQVGTRPLLQGVVRGDGFLGFEQASFAVAIHASALRLSDRVLVPGIVGEAFDSSRPVPAKGGYFANVETGPASIAFMPIEGGYRTVIRPLPGNRVVNLTLDRKNADALVWVEAADANDAATLFTSPFTTTEAGVVRRAVARLPSPTPGVANAGVFATKGTFSHLRLMRMSDGLGWDVAGEPDGPVMAPLWANDDSIWAYVSMLPEGVPGFPSTGGAIRVKRDTLGAPTIPSGL